MEKRKKEKGKGKGDDGIVEKCSHIQIVRQAAMDAVERDTNHLLRAEELAKVPLSTSRIGKTDRRYRRRENHDEGRLTIESLRLLNDEERKAEEGPEQGFNKDSLRGTSTRALAESFSHQIYRPLPHLRERTATAAEKRLEQAIARGRSVLSERAIRASMAHEASEKVFHERANAGAAVRARTPSKDAVPVAMFRIKDSHRRYRGLIADATLFSPASPSPRTKRKK